MATVAELLQQYGVTDPSQIGFRYVDIPDPTVGEGMSGTATGAEYFNKATGTAIPDVLGNNQYLVVDKGTGQVKVQQGATDSFFGGLLGRVGDIASNPGVQYIAGSALLGNLAAGNLGTLGAAGTAATPTAEAAMADLMATEAAGAGAGALSGLSASQIANLAKAGVSVAGLLGAGSAASKIGSSGDGAGATSSGSVGYTPEYYAQLQQYYNKYLPSQPMDVVSPLAQWYGTTFNTPAQGTLSPAEASAGLRMGGLTPAAVQQVQQLSIADKARTYNDLLSAGLTDAQARQTVEQQMGTQTDSDWQYLQNAAQVQTVSSSTNPLVKAQEYNNLVAQGLNDTQIRSLVEASVGPQTDSDWQYLKLLAGA